ncbi:MAG TPA: hypothetical protein VGR37_07050 [Longimicrobiaceae bacterium]|nr:hypothetical protein [Longimicrobiaceae bacterium]
MQQIISVFGAGLFVSFVLCCVASAMLQVLAWTRHAREGAPVSIRALWKPEEHFDEVGIRQIGLARTLLTIGGVAYLSLGVLTLAARAVQ